jgi:hypothetical protein
LTKPLVHAPDGGLLGHALCESPNGDVTDYERDVDCPDCLDALEGADWGICQRMSAHGFQFLSPDWPTRQAGKASGVAAPAAGRGRQ